MEELVGLSTRRKVPLVAGSPSSLITVYLGAGKSTLVNYILSAQHGKRIAVVLNEFREEIGLERAMINKGQDGALVEEWVELANGYVCCTVKHSLVQALEQLVQTKERMDYILLETIGLADPAPLVPILWLDDQLESSIKFYSIVMVIDAKAFRLQIDEHKKSSSFPEAFHQIAFADVVILNKVDLVEDNLEDLERQILEVNALVTVVQSVRCQVDLNKVFDQQAYGAKGQIHRSCKNFWSTVNQYHLISVVITVFLPCAFVSKDPVSLAKTKFVFASTFVASTLGYSVAIAYSLSGRAAKMSLIRPRPDHVAGTPTNFHGPDRWETGDDPDYASTWLQFTPVIFFHIAIIGHLCLKRPRDVFQLTKGSPKQKDLLHRKKKQREGNEGGDKENKDAEANKEEDDEEEGEEEEEKAKVKKSKTKLVHTPNPPSPLRPPPHLSSPFQRTPSARPTFSLPCTAMTPLPGPLNRIPSNTFMASATRLFLNSVTTISLYAVAAGSSPRLSIPFHTLQACKRQRTSPRGSILRPAARSTSRSATRRTPVPVLGLLDHLLGDIGHLADGADDVGDEGPKSAIN
uniref:CobW/HypB/UreG nucleotide-binding domain-containing protein n=1 Tax=Oryza nivara TaxID=4536 RepID=A0A0E0I353_ORYNI